MVDVVKTRSYDTGRRAVRTRATRLRVIEAARSLFLQHGYPGTTMDAISRTADVPVATMYRLFPSKREVLKAVVDVSAGGDDEPIALHDRPDVRALHDEPDPRRYLAGWANLVRVLHERVAPMEAMLQSASAVDPDAVYMLSEIRRQRFTGIGVVARGLAQRNALKRGITEKIAHDILYGLMSSELRGVLLGERRWTIKRYERWLADAMADCLMKP